MTRDDDFIGELENYLDEYEGLNPMPDAIRDAIRAELPKTKQIGPLSGPKRYLSMSVSIPAPARYGLAAAAAILVAAVGAAALIGRNTGGPTPNDASPTPSPVPAASIDPCEGSAVTTGGGTIDVVWCVLRGAGERVVIPFTMTAPAEWADQHYTGGESLYLRPAGGGAIAFFIGGPDTAEAWADDIGGRTDLVVSDPESFSIGGASGLVFDVSLAPGTDAAGAAPLIVDSDLGWRLQEGGLARVWLVDADPEAIAIVVGGSAPKFEAWANQVADSLQTIEWGS